MARNQKDTVEYFPHIAKPGKTIYILENKFGNDGYAFWFKLLELLCQTEGHFLDCSNEMVWQFLVAKTKVSEIPGSEILDLLANLGNIDSELWKQNKVIWCESLILNIKDVYTKRGRDAPLKPNYCHQESTSDVISEPAIKHSLITVPETPPNDDSRRKSTQSKVKESKEKIYVDFFENKFWPIYPARNGKKIGKEECFLFVKNNISLDKLPLLENAVKNYATSPDVKKGIGIKDPIRFLKPKKINGTLVSAFWQEWIKSEEENSNKIDDFSDFNLPGNNKLIDTDAYIKAQDALFSK